MSKLVSINDIVNDWLEEHSYSNNRYTWAYHLSVRKAVEWKIVFFNEVKTVKLPVNESNKTVALPTDYLKWVKVGVLNHSGEIAVLRVNTKISSYAALHKNRADKNEYQNMNSDMVTDYTFHNVYLNDSLFTQLLGKSWEGGYKGSFKVDETQNVILLNFEYTEDHIMLEYQASINETEEVVIPIEFRQALIDYLSYTISKRNKNKVGLVTVEREDYALSLKNARRAYSKYNGQELYQLALSRFNLGLKK